MPAINDILKSREKGKFKKKSYRAYDLEPVAPPNSIKSDDGKIAKATIKNTDSFPSTDNHTSNKISKGSDNSQTTIGQQSDNNRTTVGQQSDNNQTTIGQQSDNSQTTVGQQSDNKSPKNNHGSTSSK